jgi:hypothetical protein
MLTFRDHLRLSAKDVEFYLPDAALRLALSSNILKSPYTDKDHTLKCIFIHVPKSAGTSVRKALYGTKSFHIPAARYKAADPLIYEQYFKFCFVRNPWDRLLSAYEYLKKRCDGDMAFPDHRWAASNLSGYDNFRDFVTSLENLKTRKKIKSYIHFRDQIDWISSRSRGRSISMNFFGRYENFQEDYRYVCRILELPPPSLPSERKSTHGQDYRKVYTTKMVDLVEDIYKPDIEAFGYKFE